MISQVFLNHFAYAQNIMNIGFSIAISAYLFYYRPFRKTSIFVSIIIGEMTVLIVFSACILFLLDLQQEVSEGLEYFIIFTVLIGMCAQLIVVIYTLIAQFRETWMKIEKRRAVVFLKANDDRIHSNNRLN